MKKKFILMSVCSLLCIGVAAFAAISFKTGKTQGAIGEGDYYTITINAEDVTTSPTTTSGTYAAYTDQLHNPITFNYENIKYENVDNNKYLVFEVDAFFGNDKNSQIRRLENVKVYGDSNVFSYDYGWGTKSGSIVYTNEDFYHYANGTNVSFGGGQPNYFTLMHRDGENDVKISQIVFTYSKECTPGVKPDPITFDHITISGQTTSLTRGNAFSFGGTVTAHYSNESTADVTSSATFSGYNMATSGNYTVTVSYTEGEITKTTTYSLTVNKTWSALWSGSKSLSWNIAKSIPSDIIIYTNTSLPNNITIRITFTLSNKLGNNGGYCTGSTSSFEKNTTSKPGSPKQYSGFSPTSNYTFVGVSACPENSIDAITQYVTIYWDKTNQCFKLCANRNKNEGIAVSSGTLSASCTKIERYY